MSHFPILATKNLFFRKLHKNDQKAILELRSDPGQNLYLDRPIARSLEDAREFINHINKDSSDNNWIYWAITLKNQDDLIGTICLWNITFDSNQAEIGFELLPEYHGKGFIQESIECILNYGFETIKLLSISAVVHPKNSKSINLLEKFHFTPHPDLALVESKEVYYILRSKDYKLGMD